MDAIRFDYPEAWDLEEIRNHERNSVWTYFVEGWGGEIVSAGVGYVYVLFPDLVTANDARKGWPGAIQEITDIVEGRVDPGDFQ